MNEAHANRIVEGYVAQANDTISGVGSSVNMLMETLSDDELRDARRATIMGDVAMGCHRRGEGRAAERRGRQADPPTTRGYEKCPPPMKNVSSYLLFRKNIPAP